MESALLPSETVGTPADYEAVSQWLQTQLGSRDQFTVCCNHHKTDEAPYLLLTTHRDDHRLVFEDTVLQQGRAIDFKLYMGQHVIIGHRFTMKEDQPNWTKTQRLNEHASNLESAHDMLKVIEGDGTLPIHNIIERAIQYFFALESSPSAV